LGLLVLQHLAGHSSLATTQRYIDVNDAMLKKAVNLMG
jgi:integrase/recombinase XerD